MKLPLDSVLSLAALCALAFSGESSAYDADTHALVTAIAYDSSSLNPLVDSSVITRLGLDRLGASAPFVPYWSPYADGLSFYFDNAPQSDPTVPPSTDFGRYASGYESCVVKHLIDRGLIPRPGPMVDASGSIKEVVENWILRGDIREDDVLRSDLDDDPCQDSPPDEDPWGGGDFRRVLSHFYDPIHNIPLTPEGVACEAIPLDLHGTCNRSTDWALGEVNAIGGNGNNHRQVDTGRRNHFSYFDARENYWLALTGERGKAAGVYGGNARSLDSVERLYRWATMFRALGDTIHLLQDGAQPQHVRNDRHNPQLIGLERPAFEHYTNARVTASVDDLNPYVRGFYDPPAAILPPPIDLSNPYPKVSFTKPIRFFTSRLPSDDASVLPDNRYGIMDYANRGFFTAGTLPGNNTFAKPDSNIDESHGYYPTTLPCIMSSLITNRLLVQCKHLTHAVPDSLFPAYQDKFPASFDAPPLLSESTLGNLAGSFGAPAFPQYALGLEELQTIGNLNLPRAVSYSRSLLDFFFRGRLTITAPSDGVIAILNHGVAHSVDSDGIPRVASDSSKVFGFERVRVRVSNTTPAIDESGSGRHVVQSTGAPGSQLVAVARYHRNPCYTPTLSGERGIDYQDATHSPPDCGSSRTPYQEISVSFPVVPAMGEIDGSSPMLEEFDFSADPIPINATDLFIQIVYKGQLGDEDDGIAVGMLDVSEPTYLSVYNLDYYQAADYTWLPWSDANGSLDIENWRVCFADDVNSYVAFETSPGEYFLQGSMFRLAVVTDNQVHKWNVHGDYVNPLLVDMAAIGSFNWMQWFGAVRQAGDEKGTIYLPAKLQNIRGFNLGDEPQSMVTQLSYGSVPFPPNLPNMWSQIGILAAAANGMASAEFGETPLFGTLSCN